MRAPGTMMTTGTSASHAALRTRDHPVELVGWAMATKRRVVLLAQGPAGVALQRELMEDWSTVLCGTTAGAIVAVSSAPVAALVYLPLDSGSAEAVCAIEDMLAAKLLRMPATVIAHVASPIIRTRVAGTEAVTRQEQGGHQAFAQDDAILSVSWPPSGDTPSLYGVLRTAVERAQGEEAVQTFVNRFSGIPRRLVAWGLAQEGRSTRVRAAATAFGITRRSLCASCHRANIPSPQVLLAWCRMIRLTQHLASSSTSIETVAYALDFGSAPALRNFTRRTIGRTPTALRTPGAILEVIRAADALVTGSSARFRPRACVR